MVKEFKQTFLLRRDTPHTSVHDVYERDFPSGSDGKESACNAEDTDSIPGLGGSFEEGNGYPLLYSCLEIAWTEVYEKVLSITNYQGNTNQNYNEISLCTCQYDNYQTDKQQTINMCWQGYGENGVLIHYQWKYKMAQPLWKIIEPPQKN